MSPAVERVRTALETHGCNPRPSGNTFAFRCPCHDDRQASGSLSEGDDGRALVHCHAGCDYRDITQTLGLELTDLFAEEPREPRRIVAEYDYHDQDDHLIYQVVRYAPKDFRQRRPDGNGGWDWGRKGLPPTLYRLPAVLATAETGGTVYVVEGEKDADRINELDPDRTDYVATCNLGGAGKWRPEFADHLAGAGRVIIVADKDEPGREHAKTIAASINGKVAVVEIVEAKTGKDAADHLAAGYGLEDFVPTDSGVPPVEAYEAEDVVPADDEGEEPTAVISTWGLSEVTSTPAVFDAHGYYQRGGFGMRWAKPGSFKSYLELWNVLGMLKGNDEMLMENPEISVTRRWSRVLWVSYEESPGSIRARMEALCASRQIDLPTDDEFVLVNPTRTHSATGEDIGPRVTLADVDELLEQYGPADAVFFDPHTLACPSRWAGRDSVNWDVDNDAAYGLGSLVREVASRRETWVQTIHHPNKGGADFRGASSWMNAVDMMFKLEYDRATGLITISCDKAKNCRPLREFVVRVQAESHTEDGHAILKAMSFGGIRELAGQAPVDRSSLAILEALDDGPLFQSQISTASGKSRETVRTKLKWMLGQHYVATTGNTKSGSPEWIITSTGAVHVKAYRELRRAAG